MKKKILSVLLSVLICFCLIGCNNNNSDGQSINGDNGGSKSTAGGKINFNDEKNLSTVTLQVVEVNLTDDVSPKAASGYYYHYTADSGEIYLDVVMKVKNTSKSAISISDFFDGNAIVNGNKYSGFAIVEEDNRSDFSSYGSIDPLSTEYVHILVSVPGSTTANDKISVEIIVDGNTYTLDASSAITKTKTIIEETTKVIANKEKQTVEKVAEFYIEKSSIAKRINPPKAKGYYSYYEAKGDKVYVDVIFSYKNLSTVDVDCDELFGGVKLIYAGDYEYSGFAIVEEDNRSDFTYASITSISPLTTEYVHYLFELPSSLKDDSGSLVLHFRIGDNLYKYTVR